jgi:arylsulfatase A-like enzyme
VHIAGGSWWANVAGNEYSCGLRVNALFCWGRNDAGQLGDGTTVDRNEPTQVAGQWKTVAPGDHTTCAIRSDDTLWCWGANDAAQLGDGTASAPRPDPVQVGNGAWKSVTVGGVHACGIRSDATLWCWGGDDAGQVGDGPTAQDTCDVGGSGPIPCANSPTQVGGGSWALVSAGGDHTCALSDQRALWCWGRDDAGQVGDGMSGAEVCEHGSVTIACRTAPVQIETSTWTSVSAGSAHSCGIRADARLACWGDDGAGQLGDGPTAGEICGDTVCQPSPALVGNDSWSSVSAGGQHACGLSPPGRLRCWGENVDGRLGDGTTTDRDAPTPIGTFDNWYSVDAGATHTQALLQKPTDPPNVVLVMTDDMHHGDPDQVANLKPGGGFDWMRSHGTRFERMYSTDNVCCPGRATMLTGQTAYNHGVFFANQTFKDLQDSLPSWLQSAGYCTGFTGKYMNLYGASRPRPGGWTHWEPLVSNVHDAWMYRIMKRDGVVWQPGEYTTDHLASISQAQLTDCLDTGKPTFTALWPVAPHLPEVPEPDYEDVEVPWTPPDPSYDEADLSDKPPVVQLRTENPFAQNLDVYAPVINAGRIRTLLSVDDALKNLIDTLDARGELSNTVIILTSDNGFLMGEHKIIWLKELPYEAAQQPLLIAGPGFAPVFVQDAFVTNLDIAPTIKQIAGLPDGPGPLDANIDGRRIQSILADPERGRDRFLPIFVPIGDSHAVKTWRYKYVSYEDGSEELYDLLVDPYEMESKHDDPTYAAIKIEMVDLLEQGKTCAGSSCRRSAPPQLQH